MKLYSYQKELVNSKSDRILVNWCRGAGKDIGIAAYILENKPKKVFIDGNILFYSIANALSKLSETFNVTINESKNIPCRTSEITVKFKTTDFLIHIKMGASSDFNFRGYDLVVLDMYPHRNDALDFCEGKVVKVETKNKCHYSLFEKDNYDISEIDYRDAIKEGSISLDNLLEAAMESQKKGFYNNYAIKDEINNEYLAFNDFKEKAIHRLQKQFLDTNDSKDTVLTRKNIIEMIKDLKGIN